MIPFIDCKERVVRTRSKSKVIAQLGNVFTEGKSLVVKLCYLKNVLVTFTQLLPTLGNSLFWLPYAAVAPSKFMKLSSNSDMLAFSPLGQ